MIAKNEEKVIGRAIDSCKGVVDEIILVDTGSEDRTVKIAKAKGAKVYFFAWKNDFAAAKNYALSKAKGDWIVFLDADEYFGDDTGGNLRAVLKQLEKQYDAVATYMINLDAKDGRQLETMVQMRIFKNDKNIRYISPIHEVLYNFKPGKKINAFMFEEKNILVLHHTGYSRFDRGIKGRRNLEILLQQLEGENIQPAYYLFISDAYLSLEEWENALVYAKKSIEAGVELVAFKTRPYQNLIDAMLKLQYPKLQIMQEVEAAIEKFPWHPQFSFYMANSLFADRKYDEALVFLKKTVDLQKNYREVEINGLAINFWYVYNALGANYEMRGENEQAIQYYQLALQKDWNNINCCRRLISLLRYKSLKEATVILDAIFDVNDEECLNFLLECLVNTATPELFAHYVVIRQKLYPQQDFILLQMLLANKYYQKTVPVLLECAHSDDNTRVAIIAAAGIMLSENEFYQELAKILPLSLQEIIYAYFGKEANFEGISPQVLVEFVHIFLLWGESSQTEKILALRKCFSPELTIDLGLLLLERGHFQTAYDVYRELSEQYSVGGFVYYNIGYCLHQLGKPDEAIESLLQAFDKGYRENDVYEVLRWNVEKLSDSEIKLKKRALEILKNEGAEYE